MTRNKYWKHAISLVLTMTLMLSALIPVTEINAAAKYTKKISKHYSYKTDGIDHCMTIYMKKSADVTITTSIPKPNQDYCLIAFNINKQINKKYNKYSAKWSMSKKGTVKKKVKLKKGKNYLVIYNDSGVDSSDIKISCKKAFLQLGTPRKVYVDRNGTINYN